MTAYFDEMHARVHAVVAKADWAALDEIEAAVVRDASVCSAFPDFPPDLAARVDAVVLARGVSTLPLNAPPHPGFDEPTDHAEAIHRLIWDLHTIFHDVVRVDGFTDDPLAPLRGLCNVAEERRENIIASAVKP